MIFDTKYAVETLNVDINEDNIYIWGTFHTTPESLQATNPEDPVFDYEAEAIAEDQPEPESEKFIATQITFPNGVESEPTVELSKSFDNLDDAAKFIADDSPLIESETGYPKLAYDGYDFGGIFFAGWRITRGGKEIASCDSLGYPHGDEEVVSLVDKYFGENDGFVIPDAPSFLDTKSQDDYNAFRPKVEIVKAVFKNSELLDVKEILTPLANQAEVELGYTPQDTARNAHIWRTTNEFERRNILIADSDADPNDFGGVYSTSFKKWQALQERRIAS